MPDWQYVLSIWYQLWVTWQNLLYYLTDMDISSLQSSRKSTDGHLKNECPCHILRSSDSQLEKICRPRGTILTEDQTGHWRTSIAGLGTTSTAQVWISGPVSQLSLCLSIHIPSKHMDSQDIRRRGGQDPLQIFLLPFYLEPKHA